MNPQILNTLKMLSNSNNPLAMMQQMYGNNPKFQQFMGMVNGKTPQEQVQFVKNMFNEQGINVDNLINMAHQFGLIK